MNQRILFAIAWAIEIAAIAAADELHAPVLGAGGTNVAGGSVLVLGQFAVGSISGDGQILHQGAVPVWFSPPDDGTELLTDGSFETGTVPHCNQGIVPSTWFASSLSPDVYSFDCLVRPGLDPDAFGNFTSISAAEDGLRFVAGAAIGANGEAFGQRLAAALTPAQRYRLSGYFTVSDRYPPDGVYDIYLSSTQSISQGLLVGSIGDNASIGIWTADTLVFVGPPGADQLPNIIMNPRIPNGADWRYLGTDLWSLVAEECPGDLDGSGAVELADLAVLLSNFGTLAGATREDGDLDGDGDVELADLAILLANFGAPC